jgi:type II secretory pathway component PulF
MGRGRQLHRLALFTRQLYVLISCGTPLLQALSALERQSSDEAWQGLLRDVRVRVEEGASLSEAMEVHRECFDSVCRTLVAAGESSGELPEMLDRLATLLQQQQQVRRAIVGALMYPSLLIVVALGALGAMVTVVLPKFAGLFETLDVPLPPTTRMLMAGGDALTRGWWVVLIVLVALVAGMHMALRSKGGRRWFDRLLVRMPKLGAIVRSFATARIARLLGVLIQSHVPLLDSLDLTRRSLRHTLYADLLGRAEEIVGRGEPLSAAFMDASLIDPAVYEAMRSGEQAGQVGTLLLNLADFMDTDNETTVRSLTTIIEPVILIILGLLIGFVAISLFLPLFDLTAMTQGGG